MSQTIVPEQFDWVGARARCIPWTVMEILRGQARADIEIRNALTPEQGFPKRTFQLQEGNNWFAVIVPRPYENTHKGVIFRQAEAGIQILDASTRNVLHDSILTLSDDGNCHLKVGAMEYTFWQFRKLALHDLFFVDQEVMF